MIHAIPKEVIIGMNYSKAGRCRGTEVICPGWQGKCVSNGAKKCFLCSLLCLSPPWKTGNCFPLLAPILSVRNGARCWLYGSGTAWCHCRTPPTQLLDTFADVFQHSVLIWKTLKQNASQKGKAPRPARGCTAVLASLKSQRKKGIWWHSPASWSS